MAINIVVFDIYPALHLILNVFSWHALRSPERRKEIPMKTLIYGAGPIGQWLALRLHLGGQEVTLLARGTTHDTLAQNGARMLDANSGERLQAKVPLVRELGENDRYELVVVPMVKSSRVAVLPILARNRHLENVLFLGNEVSGADAYLEHLSADQVLLGFPGAGGGWDNGDLIIAEGEQAGGKGKLFIGELDGRERPRTARIKTSFESAGLSVSLEPDIDGWLKYHFAFVAPTAGAIFSRGGDLKAVARDPDLLHRYSRACREAGDVLRAVGFVKRYPWIFNLYYWLPRWLEPWVFAKLFGSEEAAVRFGLHAKTAGPELSGLLREFAVLKGRAGIETPTLDALLASVPGGGATG